MMFSGGDFKAMLAAWMLYKQLEEIAGENYTITHNNRGTYITVNGEQWYSESSHPTDIICTLQEILKALHSEDDTFQELPKRPWGDGPEPPPSSGNNGAGV